MTLRPGRRVAVLRELREAGQIEPLCCQCQADRSRPGRPRRHLAGKPKPIEDQTLGELAATTRFAFGCGGRLPARLLPTRSSGGPTG